MKQIISILVLLIFGLFSFSCNKNANTQTSRSNNNNSVGIIEPSFENNTRPMISGAGGIGYILRGNASLMILEADTGEATDTVKWGAAMTLGEKVTAMGNRKATWNGRVYDFIEVRRDDGKEGLAFDTQIAIGATLAVVVDDKANLYNSAKAVDVTGLIISQKTIVALISGTESDGYVEIKAYDPVADRNRQDIFVRLNSISRKNSDIQSSILLQIAQPLKNEGTDLIRKEALLQAAMENYQDSVFSAEIMALVNPNAAVTIRTESVNRPFMSANTDAEVRDLPDLVAGKLIGRLSDGAEVTVSERTVNTSTVNGQSNRWYRITEPFEGWVFGTYLD
jgi:hypothetical protein